MSAPAYKHMPQSRAALAAAGYPDPNRREPRKGPDFTREGDILYPVAERAQEFVDDSDEQELDFSGGVVWTEELADNIRYAGLVVEGE